MTDVIFFKDPSTNLVGKISSYNVTFRIVISVDAGGQVKLTFPSGVVYKEVSAVIVCTNNNGGSVLTRSSTADSDNNVSEILISDASPSGRVARFSISYNISFR